ncbi:MAG: hypothetical protein H3C47_01330 [Candidatus Cloacimonetes bacterium]|nr:hypothetical protein [Candidatus Cloacimonadota bacterium]
MRARVSAYNQVIHVKMSSESEVIASLNELEVEQFEQLLNQLFLNSSQLGRGYQKHIGLSWEKEDFQNHLSSFAIPCFAGNWIVKPKAVALLRTGCKTGQDFGSRACQYFRESIDGLVLGLSDEVGYARHHSVMSGDTTCKDVFFNEEPIPTDAMWRNPDRYAPASENMQVELDLLVHEFDRQKMKLSFLGLLENALVYKMEPKEAVGCSASVSFFRNLLIQKIKQKFPHLTLRDASPISVYGERA